MKNKTPSQAPGKVMLWRANETIGVNVVSIKGEDLGCVEDIVLDRNASRIAYVIVSYGGLLGFWDKHFAVPWQAFSQTVDRDLSLGIDPEQLKNAPGFEKGTLPDTTDPLFHEKVHSFYNTKPYSLEEKARAELKASMENVGERTSDWRSWWDWDSWVKRGDDTTWARRLGELIGTKIEDAQGEIIAELEDVIVESREARAVYAVVSHDDTLGVSAGTAIIPWNTLRLNVAREVYVTNVTLDQLKQPNLNGTEHRSLENREYSEALYGAFGTKPFWEEFGYESEMN